MKVLVLCDKSGTKAAEELLGEMKKRRIAAALCRPDADDGGGEAFVFLKEEKPVLTHVVTVFSDFPAFVPGLFFGLGFALGANLPLVHYGPDLDPRLLKQGVAVKNKGDFIAYIEGEVKNRAVEDGRKKARTALLDMGIPCSAEALENCIGEGNTRAVHLFLEAGFSPNARNKNGVPLLNLASRAGNRDLVNMLIKAGAEVNSQAADRGNSALIDGAMGKHGGIVEDLLAAGAEANLKSKDGQSALVISVGLNDTICAELLLKAGANADDPDSLGASARRYAHLFNKPDMVALFNAYALQ